MKHTIQIRCKNNKKTQKIAIGSTLSEIYNELNLKMDFGPVSAKVNNKVEGMHYRVYNDKDIEFLDLHSPSGLRAYTRSLFFVLCKAVHDLYPEGSVVIERILLRPAHRPGRNRGGCGCTAQADAGDYRCRNAHTPLQVSGRRCDRDVPKGRREIESATARDARQPIYDLL